MANSSKHTAAVQAAIASHDGDAIWGRTSLLGRKGSADEDIVGVLRTVLTSQELVDHWESQGERMSAGQRARHVSELLEILILWEGREWVRTCVPNLT